MELYIFLSKLDKNLIIQTPPRKANSSDMMGMDSFSYEITVTKTLSMISSFKKHFQDTQVTMYLKQVKVRKNLTREHI